MLANAKRHIGTFDQKAILLSASESFDGAGQKVESYSEGESLWCREVPQRGFERFTSQQFIGKSVLVLEFREYRDYVTVLHRVRFRGKDWQVHDVRPVGRNEGMELEMSVRSE